MRVALNRVLDDQNFYDYTGGNKNEVLLSMAILDLGIIHKMHLLAGDLPLDHVCDPYHGCNAETEHSYWLRTAELAEFRANNPKTLTNGQYKKVSGLAWQKYRSREDGRRTHDTDLKTISLTEFKRQVAEDLGLR